MKTTQIAPLRAPQRPLKVTNGILNGGLSRLSGLGDWSSPAFNIDIRMLCRPVVRFGNDMAWMVFALGAWVDFDG